MLVSGAQQSDSVTYICVCVCILFHILFHYRFLKGIEYSSLCYTVGPCCLSVLYTVICIGPASVLLLMARLVFPLCSLHGLTSLGGFPRYTLPTTCLHSTHQRPDPPHIFLPLGFPLQGTSTNLLQFPRWRSTTPPSGQSLVLLLLPSKRPQNPLFNHYFLS